MGSHNVKTGNMAQVWLLLRDMGIGLGRQTGHDVWICGDCPFKSNSGCYVAPMGPSSVWRTYQAGKYPQLPWSELPSVLAGRVVRLGAYGDPAFLPIGLLQALTSAADGHTGYTHAWRHVSPDYSAYLMASCDRPEDAPQARQMGYRTFTLTVSADAPKVLPGIGILCPASEQAGKRTTCAACGLCDGSRGPQDRRAHIYIPVHGYQAKVASQAIAARV
jgi:hypothetical protein